MASRKFDEKDILRKLGNLFRKYGYHGTSYACIQEASGLGKGSLYHHFAAGKKDIGRAVLNDVHAWFETNIYIPLERDENPRNGIDQMFQKVLEFFENGDRVCVPGSFALYDARDAFPEEIQNYFRRWVDSLANCLVKAGLSRKESRERALDLVGSIQGALVLGRALQDSSIFVAILRSRKRELLERIESA